MEAESRLASPMQNQKSASSSRKHGESKYRGLPYDKLLSELTRTESELQRLKLRIDGRPSPYYRIINEFFEGKL